jgi:hypothetical protein
MDEKIEKRATPTKKLATRSKTQWQDVVCRVIALAAGTQLKVLMHV